MIAVLQQLGVTWRDAFLLGLMTGVWVAGRNRRTTGERIGAVEKTVSEVRGLLDAIRGSDGK